MIPYHSKKAVEILREEGLVELSKSTYNFIRRQMFTKSDLLWEYEKQK